MTRNVRTSPAFSLLEMLVAIALLAVLLSAVYAFTWNLFDRETRTLDEAAKSQAATMLFDRLEADLMSAVAIAGDGVGLDGERERLTIAHRSVLPGSRNAPHADLQTTSIRFDARARRVSITRDDSSSGAGTPPGAGPESGRIPVPVRALRLRYHNGKRWSERFSSGNGLPVAVELAVWFGRPDDPADSNPGFGTAQPFGAGDAPGLDPRAPSGSGGFGVSGSDPIGSGSLEAEEPEDLGQPDRVRIITIPDAVVPRGTGRAPASGGAP